MRSLGFLIIFAALTACSSYSPDLGGAPFLCDTDEPRCPDGYACQDDGTGRMVCFSESGGIVDAAPVGFQCADDSILEGAGKNDTIQTAYATPVATQRKDISFAGLAICPEGDKDTYTVNITTANSNLEAVSTWESGMPISVSILGSGGATLNNGTSSGENSLRAYVANLPVATYYVQTYAAANVKNNYKVTITVTP
jgi:hypothetical protein